MTGAEVVNHVRQGRHCLRTVRVDLPPDRVIGSWGGPPGPPQATGTALQMSGWLRSGGSSMKSRVLQHVMDRL